MAGYSENTAKDIGCENLAKPNIQDAIEKAQKERSKRVEVTQDRVIEEMLRLSRKCLMSEKDRWIGKT